MCILNAAGVASYVHIHLSKTSVRSVLHKFLIKDTIYSNIFKYRATYVQTKALNRYYFQASQNLAFADVACQCQPLENLLCFSLNEIWCRPHILEHQWSGEELTAANICILR